MTLTSSKPSSLKCKPQWATKRTPDRHTIGARIAKVAELAGWSFMPWQTQVGDVIGEQLAARPAYREVDVTVPRQSGKTVLQFAVALDRCINWGSPQRVAYTAQTGWDARRKLVDDVGPHLLRSKLAPAIEKVFRGAGNESIIFKNGSRIDVLASNEQAGHGRTLDLAIMDEAFADTDFRREQAALPAMATRSDAQMLIFSTAGTAASTFLKHKVEIGRQSVEDDIRNGVAYFEWSAGENDDPDDRDVWWACMPALGHTIDESTVEHARRTMTDGDFRRAYLNQWTVSDDRVIPDSAWRNVCDPNVVPQGGLVLAADAKPDHSSAAIVVADSSGRAELIEHHDGVGWVTDRLEALSKTHDASVVVDKRGPLGFIADELSGRRVPLVEVSTAEYVNATGALFTNVMDKRVQIRTHPALDAAVSAARKRKVGDAWVWTRSDTESDVCPLVAVTLALGTAFVTQKDAEIGVMLV